jgi:hypothetical protein
MVGDCLQFEFGTSNSVYSIDNTGPGIHIYRPNVNMRNVNGILDGNSDGIEVDLGIGNVFLSLNYITGTNTGYGIDFQGSGQAIVTSNTAVTGGSGDATIDEGNTALDWSTDFGSDRDKVVNLDNLCMIERQD